MLDVKQVYCFILEGMWWLGGLIKRSYKFAGKPLEPIVFDWNRNVSQAFWNTHRAMGLHHERDAVLVKVTKIQDDNFTENDVCGRAYILFLCL